ncbi:MAG TPA: hypothetical protein DD490_11990 [Acidobacteria bacterium]|nr:hypothetical protein [Acidobacteriota bacterium]
MPGEPGRIITFYSYKGGTGRTMALANVAWILASNGKRVLAVDWDLEAPGLHHYFRPFLLDQDLTASSGLIDLVWDFAAATVAPLASPKDAQTGWHEEYADILRYVIALRWGFRAPGKLDFLPPGRQGPAYAARVNSFNWQNFYDRLGGGAFLETVKERMREEYDYVLIDSRTGVSDTSGICTVQMPDDLVACFTANHQSLEGAAAVASSVRDQWVEAGAQKEGGRIFPVLTRVDSGELLKLGLARREAQGRFAPFIERLPADVREVYWGDVEIAYVPWYAFEEVLAPFVEEPGRINSMLGSAERLTWYLTDRKVARAVSPDDKERARVLKQYLRSVPAVEARPAESPKPAAETDAASLPTKAEPGHRETQTDLPFLLKPGRFWPGWSLPATTLSVASAAMLGLAFLLLQAGQPMFVLPVPLSRSLAVLTAGLAWSIALACRHRPGGLWPRLWALGLAVLTSATPLLSLSFAESPWLHALVAAGFAAMLTLLPRLFKVRPDSGLLPYIPLLAFFGAVFLTPAAFWLLGLKSIAAMLGL